MGLPKGRTNNPNGRPKGVTLTSWARLHVRKNFVGILRPIIDAAIAGDTECGRFLLSKMIASPKPVAEPVVLPPTASTPLEQAGYILARAQAGEISLLDAKALIDSLAQIAKQQEALAHREHLAALEARLGGQEEAPEQPSEATGSPSGNFRHGREEE